MIIIAQAKLRFLKTGRILVLEVPKPDRYKTGRIYAVGLRHNRTICHVEIVRVQDDGLTVRLAGQDPTHLLATHSQFGYTSDPHRALRGEPEAVDPREVARLTRVDRERREQEQALFARRTILHADELAIGADGLTRKRLRSIRAIASKLNVDEPAA